MEQFAASKNGAQRQTNNGHALLSPSEVAQIAASLGLTTRDGDTWRGPDPKTGEGTDRFCLYPEGNATNRKDGQKYSRAEVLELARQRGYSSHSAPAPTNPARLDWKSATVYDYTDEGGALLFQVGRSGNGDAKRISQRRPDGRGAWIYNLQSARRVLYRLPDVMKAQTVVICEGEKDAEALNQQLKANGQFGPTVATTNPHGAEKWRDEHSPTLAGKAVIVWPDADEPGARHAAQVCASVTPHAASVKRLTIPSAQLKDGAADFFTRSGTLREFWQIADAAPDWRAEAPSEAPTEAAPRRQFAILGAQAVKDQPAPAAIVEGVLYENGAAELCGSHGTFKSFQALGIAEAVAGGHDWHGRQTKQTPVVYITGEGRAGLKQRIQALEIRHQRPSEAQFILEAVQLHRPDEVEALLWAIAQLPEAPGLIIVDTLARCFVGGDENSARDAGLFVAGVDRIRAATGAAVLILHHLSKAGDARGSTAFSGAFDTIIEARRENTTITLSCLKQKDAAEFEKFTLVRRVVELPEVDEHGHPITSLIFEPTDTPAATEAASKADQTRQRILKVLRVEFPKGARKGELWAKCEALKFVSKSGFYSHLKALEDAENIQVDSWGLVQTVNLSNLSNSSNLDNLDAVNLSNSSNNPLGLDKLDKRESEGLDDSIFDDEPGAEPNLYGKD